MITGHEHALEEVSNNFWHMPKTRGAFKNHIGPVEHVSPALRCLEGHPYVLTSSSKSCYFGPVARKSVKIKIERCALVHRDQKDDVLSLPQPSDDPSLSLVGCYKPFYTCQEAIISSVMVRVERAPGSGSKRSSALLLN